MLYIEHPTAAVPFSKDSFKRMKSFLTCLSGIMIALLCEQCRVSIVPDPPLVAACNHVIGVSVPSGGSTLRAIIVFGTAD